VLLKWRENRSGFCQKHGRTPEARSVLAKENLRWNRLEQQYGALAASMIVDYGWWTAKRLYFKEYGIKLEHKA
jgi:hypothetical protein